MDEQSKIMWEQSLKKLSRIFKKKIYFISYDENTKELKLSFKRKRS